MREKYRCNPKRIAVLYGAFGILAIVVFYSILSILQQYIDSSKLNTWSQVGFWTFLAVYVVLSIGAILAVRKEELKLTPTEAVYNYGLFSERKVALPYSRISACAMRKTFTQRIFGTSDLIIYVEGDPRVMYLHDVEEGGKVYSKILNLIR